jgi:hypothetical protein
MLALRDRPSQPSANRERLRSERRLVSALIVPMLAVAILIAATVPARAVFDAVAPPLTCDKANAHVVMIWSGGSMGTDAVDVFTNAGGWGTLAQTIKPRPGDEAIRAICDDDKLVVVEFPPHTDRSDHRFFVRIFDWMPNQRTWTEDESHGKLIGHDEDLPRSSTAVFFANINAAVLKLASTALGQ